MSKGRPLTAEFILNKTKSDSLTSIKNLNLWGNNLDVQLVRCRTLKFYQRCPILKS
jgi:hypothetical protein